MTVALETASKLGFQKENQTKAADVFIKLYKLFKDKDATQIEINPLAEVEGGEVLCMDAKLGFDDNAEFRQEVSPFFFCRRFFFFFETSLVSKFQWLMKTVSFTLLIDQVLIIVLMNPTNLNSLHSFPF